MRLDKSKYFIHFGSNEYLPELFGPIKNTLGHKPESFSGLWGCPLDADFSWKEFCQLIDFHDDDYLKKYFIFKLRDDARVIIIDDINSLNNLDDKYLYNGPVFFSHIETSIKYINFEMLSEDYDAIIVYLNRYIPKSIYPSDSLKYRLYGWDCDSILVLNKDVIEIIDKNNKIYKELIKNV